MYLHSGEKKYSRRSLWPKTGGLLLPVKIFTNTTIFGAICDLQLLTNVIILCKEATYYRRFPSTTPGYYSGNPYLITSILWIVPRGLCSEILGDFKMGIGVVSVYVYRYCVLTQPLQEDQHDHVQSHQTDWPYIWFGDLQVVRKVRCLSWYWMSILRQSAVKQHLAQIILTL